MGSLIIVFTGSRPSKKPTCECKTAYNNFGSGYQIRYKADRLSHIKVALDILSGATFATPVLIHHLVGYP